MHSRALAERNASAQDRIKTAAEELSRRYGIEFAGFPAAKGEPAVVQMREREIVADLLESVVAALPDKKKKAVKKAQDEPQDAEPEDAPDAQE